MHVFVDRVMGTVQWCLTGDVHLLLFFFSWYIQFRLQPQFTNFSVVTSSSQTTYFLRGAHLLLFVIFLYGFFKSLKLSRSKETAVR